MLRDCTTSALLANTPVQYCVYAYDGGVPANANWMERRQKGTATTDGAGLFSVNYGGPENVGDTVYVAIFQPDPVPVESMIWTTTVQM